MRLHFTTQDMANVRIATSPAMLIELAFSVHVLGRAAPSVCWELWRRQARRVPGPLPVLRHLVRALGPSSVFFTPAGCPETLDDSLEIVRAIPRTERLACVAAAARQQALPHWFRALADGEADVTDELTGELRTYFDHALAGNWTKIRTQIDADRIARATTLANQGVRGLLGSLHPSLRWQDSQLHLPGPDDADVTLDGRGLLLAPAFFHRGEPIPLLHLDPPMIVYSIQGGPEFHRAVWGADDRNATHLADLLGPTRAAILRAVADGNAATTTEIADRLNITVGAVSKHTAVLRHNGLIISTRNRSRVHHTPTDLGLTLVHEATSPVERNRLRLRRDGDVDPLSS